MFILIGYFIRRLGLAIALCWLALIVLIAGLEIIASLDQHPLTTAALLALLQTPRQALATLPFACALAATAVLQRMEENHELQTMRAAGLSLFQAAMLMAGGGVLFSVAAVVAGEWLLEPAESVARGIQGVSAAHNNVWLHNNGVFFYAKELAPGGYMREVAVYQPEPQKLRVFTAATAQPHEEKWRLSRGDAVVFSPARLHRQAFAERDFDFPANVASLRTIGRRPREMSMRTLAAAALPHNPGHTRFAVAWWRRLSEIPAPPLLAACAIWCIGGLRRRALTAMLATTALVGVYYFAAIICAQFALLLNWPAMAVAPLLLLAGVVALGVKRQFA